MNPQSRKKLLKILPYIFIVGLGIATALPILAPILLRLGFVNISKAIYTFYSFLCHQKSSRSIHIFDHQYALCARDTFIYLSLFETALLSYKLKLKSLHWKWVVVATIPIAVNGGWQLISQILAMQTGHTNLPVGYAETTNMWRMITGTIFATGFGLYLFPSFFADIREALETNENKKKESRWTKLLFKDTRLFFIWILLLNFIIYAFMGYVWRITSPTYPPSGIIDNVSRIPGYNYEENGRGDHAVYFLTPKNF